MDSHCQGGRWHLFSSPLNKKRFWSLIKILVLFLSLRPEKENVSEKERSNQQDGEKKQKNDGGAVAFTDHVCSYFSRVFLGFNSASKQAKVNPVNAWSSFWLHYCFSSYGECLSSWVCLFILLQDCLNAVSVKFIADIWIFLFGCVYIIKIWSFLGLF